MEYPKKTYLLPIRIILIYLIVSLILYAFGPFEWVTYHPVIFWSLNIAFLLSIWMGWNLALKTKNSSVDRKWEAVDEQALARRLKPFIWINIAFEMVEAMRRFGFVSFDIPGLFASILNGFGDVGLSYNVYQSMISEMSGSDVVGGSFLTAFNLLFSFLSLNIVVLTGVLFNRYKPFYKFVIASMYLFIVIEYVSIGTNIGAFRAILAVIVVVAINFARTQKKLVTFKSKKKKYAFIAVSVVGVIIVLAVFDKIMQSRGGILIWQSSYYNVGGIGLDRDSFVFKILPSGLYMLIVALSSYISQGYYGMSLSLNIDWQPGYGFGHCRALQSMFGDLLEPVYLNTYQHRLEKFGWDEDMQWHTLYSWFANDFTYVGVIFVVFFIGFVFCKAYVDVLTYNNPYAKLVTYYFVLMCVFIPCNNQVFQSSYVLFGFIGAMILWICSRKGVTIRHR